MVIKLLEGVWSVVVMVLRVWIPFLLAASVILVASAGELPLEALPEVVLSELLP